MAAPRCRICGTTMRYSKRSGKPYCPARYEQPAEHEQRAADRSSWWANSEEARLLRESGDSTAAAEVKALYPPTYEQESIIHHYRAGDNIIVEAKAGTGKTTTLRHLYANTPAGKSVVFLAFNRRIMQELSDALGTDAVYTMNKMGKQIINKVYPKSRVNDNRFWDLSRGIVPDGAIENAQRAAFVRGFKSVMSLGVAHDDAEEIAAVLENAGLEDQYVVEAAELWTPELFEMAMDTIGQSHTFAEQIWAPVKLIELWDVIPKYDIVLVDEAQDQSSLNHEMILALGHKDTQFIAVGDRRQAIYAWRGADPESMDNIARAIRSRSGRDLVHLPLSVTFRCGHSIVEEARLIIGDDYYAAQTNDNGVVEEISEEDFLENVQPGELIISRNHGPLIKHALEFIKLNRRVTYYGKDILDEIQVLISKAQRRRGTDVSLTADLLEALSDLIFKKEQKIIDLKMRGKSTRFAELALEQLRDRVDLIEFFSQGRIKTFDVLREIDYMVNALKNEGKRSFTDTYHFGSIHALKGWEANTVWFIGQDRLPSKFSADAVEAGDIKPMQQEYNLAYVAATRAGKRLVHVGGRSSCFTTPLSYYEELINERDNEREVH